MKTKYLIPSFIGIAIIASLVLLLGAGMLFVDVFNVAVNLSDSTIFASLPAYAFSLFSINCLIYLVKITKYPNCKKRMTRLFTISSLVLGVIGTVGAVLSGLLDYHTFVGAHPFPGYLIISIIMNVGLIASGIIGLLLIKNIEEDTEKIKMTAGYIFSSIGWFIFVALMLNRLGVFIASPLFVYTRNLYLTFPFYIYLLMPSYLGILEMLFMINKLNGAKLKKLAWVGIILNLALFAYIAIMGMNDSTFVSSLSPTMPFERMLSMPIEILIHFFTYTGVGIVLLLQSKKVKE